MTKNIHVVIVHGIGKTSAGYSQPLAQGIAAKFNSYLQENLKSREDFRSHLAVQEVVWDGVLAPNQDKLVAILKKGFENFQPKGFRALMSKVFSFVTKPLLKLRTDFAAEAISDILGYRNSEAYSQIHKCITDGVERFVNVAMDPADKQHLSIICHSLGTVIASDFIYDRQKKFGHVHENFHFTNFFTLGSPIALFALQYGIELFRSPVVMEDRSGQWINIFDIDDPIAYPLKNLNPVYEQAVSVDHHVDTGGFGGSHTRYFGNLLVHEKIAVKLAEDWRTINNR